MHILILSRSENTHADVVEDFCGQYADVERINFDFDSFEKMRAPHVLASSASTQHTPDAIFVHHPRISYREEWFKDDLERKLFVASWNSTREWLEASASSAKWINRPSVILSNRNILRQLKIARMLGFKTPDTLFTNNLEALKSFTGDDNVVIKQGNLGVHLPQKRILTSIVDPEQIPEDMLSFSPCLFQKYVPKQYELRVHVIGETVFTCRIDSQANHKTRVDWRNYDLENTPHSVYSLTDTVARQCVGLVKRLGIVFGVIDLIITTEEEVVFLECNSQGHWLWIEELTGLPITKTVCDYLLRDSA